MQNQPSSRTACQAEHPWLLPKELYKKPNPKKKESAPDPYAVPVYLTKRTRLSRR